MALSQSQTGDATLSTARLSSRHLMPGPNTLSVQTIIELFPLRIGALDQPNLPRAGPLLHRLLPLDRPLDLFMGLDIDQAGDAISLGEAGAVALPVFPDAAGDVVGGANVKVTVLGAGTEFGTGAG